MDLLLEQLPFLEFLISRHVSPEQHQAILRFCTPRQVEVIKKILKVVTTKNFITENGEFKLYKDKSILLLKKYEGNYKDFRLHLVNNYKLILSILRRLLPNHFKRCPSIRYWQRRKYSV